MQRVPQLEKAIEYAIEYAQTFRVKKKRKGKVVDIVSLFSFKDNGLSDRTFAIYTLLPLV